MKNKWINIPRMLYKPVQLIFSKLCLPSLSLFLAQSNLFLPASGVKKMNENSIYLFEHLYSCSLKVTCFWKHQKWKFWSWCSLQLTQYIILSPVLAYPVLIYFLFALFICTSLQLYSQAKLDTIRINIKLWIACKVSLLERGYVRVFV